VRVRYEVLRGVGWAIFGLIALFLVGNTAAAIADLTLGLGWGYGVDAVLAAVPMALICGFTFWAWERLVSAFRDRGDEIRRNVEKLPEDLPPQGPEFLSEMLRRERERRAREGS
jgi:hypothetical protein